jgi:VIT1/CCC1 family predicted Fe2+/Mn2+ transporter
MPEAHGEPHRIEAIGWLIGVASAHAEHGHLVLTGVAGLVAGAMSMATGEYVSVSSQADTETAALAEEQAELDADGAREHRELAAIYVRRGLDMALAKQVAQALMAHDALGAHARDELGISETTRANPLQAALASASSFSVGAALPLIVTALAPQRWVTPSIAVTALLSLAILGGLAARVGGAKTGPGVVRVTFWSALSMGMASAVGALFGAS